MSASAERAETIDIHTHFAAVEESDAILAEAGLLRNSGDFSGVEARASAEVNRAQMARIRPILVDPVEKLREMDAMGVNRAVLSPPPYFFFYWTPPEIGARLARLHNDRCAAWTRLSDRFRGMASLPMQDVPSALNELVRAHDSLGLNGIAIGSNIAGRDLDDPGFEPIWRAAAERRLPVFVHPVSVAGAERMQPYYLTNLIGNPMDTTIAAARLVYGGVFERHPALTIILAHCGGAFPFLRGRIEAGWKIRPECASLAGPPRETYAGRLFLDTVAHDPAALLYAVKTFGAENVLLGSDMPFDIGERDMTRIVAELDLPPAEVQAILGGNARRLFYGETG